VEVSTSAEDLLRRARRAVEDGVERLLVAGGDGSQHLAAQVLRGTTTALAPLPLGSGNDLAGLLAVPRRIPDAIDRALRQPRQQVDTLDCRRGAAAAPSTPAGTTVGVASFGFDAAVAAIAANIRRVPRTWVYPLAVMHELARLRAVRVSLDLDGQRWEGEILLAAAANVERYGGGMRIAPGADPQDGLLDLVLVEAIGRGKILRLFPGIYRGRHLEDPRVHRLRGRRLRLEAARPLPGQGDGEALGTAARWEMEVRPASLWLVAAPDALRSRS